MSQTRILVVEDESITAMDIQERLQRLGYAAPSVAASGEEAIRRAEEERPDLVLMDIVLKGRKDGVRAAQEVQRRLGIPVVYLTAYSDEKTWERARETRPFGYLVKPVKDTDLRTSVEIALRRREAEESPLDHERWVGRFADCAEIAMITFDRSGRVTLMNATAQELTGWDNVDAFGKFVTEVFALKDREAEVSTVTKSLKRGMEAGLNGNAWLVARDGVESPIQYSVTPSVDREGCNTGAVLFFQALQGAEPGPAVGLESVGLLEPQTEESLQATPAGDPERGTVILRGLLRNIPASTVLLDSSSRVLMCNTAFENLFLYREEELLGKELDELLLIKGTGSETIEVSEAVFSGQALRTTGFRRRRDATLVDVELWSVPVFVEGKLEAIYVIYQDIAHRIHAEEQLQQLAVTDPLTGLANYRRFMDVLEAEIKRSARTNRPFALLLFDLDGLKKINDRYGHLAGSRALCRLAEILRTQCRAIDTAARFGGDEFAMLLLETGDVEARKVAQRILQRLEVEGEKPTLSASVGFAIYPEDGESSEALLEVADRALYEMKRRRERKSSKSA